MLLRRPADLAELFRDGRALRGWSQSQLANEAGVSRQWVSLVENGKTSVEFDLVVGALQMLGYRLRVDLPVPATPEEEWRAPQVDLPTHGASRRTPLTRSGEPLVRHRSRRRPTHPRSSGDPRD